jgi:hypothetical protein
MDDMSRPHFCRCVQAALAVCMTLAASNCGQGLFAPEPVVDASGDGGTSVDAMDGVAPETDGRAPDGVALEADGRAPDGFPPGTDGHAPDGVLPVTDVPILPVLDAYPDQQIVPDSTADAIGPGSSITASIDFPGGDVSLGNATLTVPRGTFAQKTFVTLTLISDDGTLADHPGAIGPIFSLSKTDALGRDVTLQQPAIFNLNFTPTDASIPAQRVVLAYLDTQSNPNLWIAILPDSSYDARTGVLTGSVFEFSGTRLFAPVESCLTGQACPDPETCGGQACQ